MIRIRPLMPDDLVFGFGLSRQAGWNQRLGDWQRMWALEPRGWFLAFWNNRPAGTVGTARFGPVAWVAMMLVDGAFRRRGIGRALLEHALGWLDEQGIRTVRLDATPMGRPLYAQFGFEAQFELIRYGGIVASAGMPVVGRGLDLQDVPRMGQVDQQVTQIDRCALLAGLLRAPATRCVGVDHDGQLLAYGICRPGRLAWHVGPCIDIRPVPHPSLLAHLLARYVGEPVFVDVPAGHDAARQVAQTLGLGPQRVLTRMCRGELVAEDTRRLWASSGPEFG